MLPNWISKERQVSHIPHCYDKTLNASTLRALVENKEPYVHSSALQRCEAVLPENPGITLFYILVILFCLMRQSLSISSRICLLLIQDHFS